MYSRILAEVKPTPTSAMLTYVNAFDSQFCPLLRERRCASLADMQDATFEVESNIIAVERLGGDADRRSQEGELSSSSDLKIEKLARMIESLASEVSRLEAEQYFEEAGALDAFSLPNPNLHREAQEQLQILQRNKDSNEDKRVKPLFQSIVMEEERFEEEDEVHGLEDKGSAPLLMRAAYEEALSKGTAREFVVHAEQQAYQQTQSAAGPTILKEPEASPSSHDHADLQIDQPAVIPSPVIKRGEVNCPSSYASLSVQVTIPHNCPLGIEIGHSSMPKADTDHLSLDILKPAQLASTQLERAVCQMIEEEDAQFWDSSLDVDCFKKNEGADDVSVSPTQEYIGSPFILVVQTTNDTEKYTTTMVIQQVYKGSHEERPRRRAYREGMKFGSSLPEKVKCPKLFEVEDRTNPILQLFDEPVDKLAERRRNSFEGPVDGPFLKIYVVFES